MKYFETIVQMLNDCEENQDKLTDWEINFISSITDSVEDEKQLTDQQIFKLEQIHEKITNYL